MDVRLDSFQENCERDAKSINVRPSRDIRPNHAQNISSNGWHAYIPDIYDLIRLFLNANWRHRKSLMT